MSDRVEVVTSDHVAEVMLNRPEKLNALDMATFEALDEVARSLEGDNTLRAVVLHGAGESFCAGIDLQVLQQGAESLGPAILEPVAGSSANIFQRAAYAWRELPVPVICALQGATFGAGFQVAMGADLRIAAPNTQLSIMESKWGLIPDMAISATLRHLLPPDRVKELAWTARTVQAEEALELGLVTAIEEDPLAAARALAFAIRDRSPDAIQGIKRLVNDAWAQSESDALALEARLQLQLLKSPNQAEAVRANLQKRKPEFAD